MPGDALDVFISYSHEDEVLRQELEEHLVRLRHEGLIDAWHDRRVTAGEEWRGWVDRDLMSADLILLIVSAPFLESDYCRDAELKHALELQSLGHAKVMPIIARPCDWRAAPFAKLATLPQGVGPVTEWHSREDAWEDVAQGIREVAERLITARLESTAEYRIAVRSSVREAERPVAAPPEEPSEPDAATAEAKAPRSLIFGGIAAALATAVAFFMWWWSRQPEDGYVPLQTAEMTPSRTESGQGPGPTAATNLERPPAPPPAASQRRTELGVEATPVPPEQIAPPDTEPTPEDVPETSSSSAATAAGEAEPAAAARDDPVPEPAVGPRKPRDLERSLGILATPGAEDEGECLAVLVAGDQALTSGVCARSSTVVVMGGNALTATRDEIFDLEPWQSSQTADVTTVKLLQDLGETYGFAATRLEEGLDHDRLTAHYVAASAIRRAECVAQARVADNGGLAYIENATFDRYVAFVEEAAAEAISVAGPEWAELLPEVLGSAEAGLAGFVCALPTRPAGNLVFSEGGHVVGIGYPCEPFDRLEPEVRDNLPSEIRELDLDCIAPLGEIREQLRAVRSETAP